MDLLLNFLVGFIIVCIIVVIYFDMRARHYNIQISAATINVKINKNSSDEIRLAAAEKLETLIKKRNELRFMSIGAFISAFIAVVILYNKYPQIKFIVSRIQAVRPSSSYSQPINVY